MKEIKIEKVTLNVGCGDDKKKIENATKLLEMLTGKKPLITKSKRRNTFGVPKGKDIGVKVTLRKKDSEDFFKLILQTVENTLRESQLDREGNINIGIREYIDMPGIKYSHDIGMLGFGVSIALQRPGYRIKRRRIMQRNIPLKHKINKEDAISWLKDKHKVQIAGE